MIFVYHIHNKICFVQNQLGHPIAFDVNHSIAKAISALAIAYPDAKIVWCHVDYKDSLNSEVLETFLHHKKILISFNPGNYNYINSAIGYVDESLFVNCNKKVCYPAWQMSSIVGMLHASVLIAVKDKIPFNSDFDYYLHSMAKLAMPLGLLCYSEPGLLKKEVFASKSRASMFTLFRFVKQHYKTRWLFFLLLNLVIYEKRLALFPFLYAVFFRKRVAGFNLEEIKVKSSRVVVQEGTIDVIIPTIGRKKYLYDVLQDLAQQTLLPRKVIIVEQNPQENSKSELEYLKNEKWPFTIKHIFTHQAGACSARNLALAEAESEWVFLNDDDNRFDKYLINSVLVKAIQYGVEVITTSYLQTNEIQQYKNIHQSGIFGSGNSFVKKTALQNVSFDMKFEFGYGEDADFGLQLRNQGHDVIYFPHLKITHLKAPMGGFRIPIKKQWESEAIQSKPSPTIMLYKQLHLTKQQIKGYKTILFFKYYSKQPIKNPIRYLNNFQKQWKQSLYWANKLRS